MSATKTPSGSGAPSLSLPCRLADYELLEEIGRGGMGIIYKARQESLQRVCAVKMLRADAYCCDESASEALLTEASAAASLDHPNIVGVYEAGRHETHLYFSMEYVAGDDLERHARTHVLGARGIARIMLPLARAIAYAHERGVVHHDLKPANVIIDAQGEPQITDFGLAQRIDAAGRRDPTHGVGTPNYLAPEQASARFGDPGKLTDVFGLGAILYFLLTDRPPFSGFTPEDVIASVLDSDPVRPSLLRPGTSADLETVCLKCLAREPARRYASAGEVADELQRFLEDKPLRARPAGLVERGRKWCRRHPAIAALASLVVVLLSLISVGTSLVAVRLDQARRRTESLELETRRNLYAADMLLAATALAQGNDAEVRAITQKYGDAPDPAGLRGWEWRFLRHASRGDVESLLGRESNTVAQIEVTPGGRFLLTSDMSGGLSVWDLERRERVGRRALQPVGAIAFALEPGGQRVLAAVMAGDTNPATLVSLRLPALTTERSLRLPARGSLGALSRDGSRLWLLTAEALLQLDAQNGSELARIPLELPRRWRELAISSDGSRLALAEPEGAIQLRSLPDGRLLARLEGHPFTPVWNLSIFCLAFSPDGRLLASGGTDGSVRLWNVENPGPATVLTGHADVVMNAAFSRDGQWLVSVGRDSFVQRVPLARPTERLQLRGADGLQTAVALLGDDRTPVSGGFDGALRLWRSQPAPVLHWNRDLQSNTAGIAPLGRDDVYLQVGADNSMRVLQLDHAAPLADWPGGAHLLASAAQTVPSPGPRPVVLSATLDREGLLRIRSSEGTPERSARIPFARQLTARSFFMLDLSSTGSLVAVADLHEGARVFDLKDFSQRVRIPSHPRYVAFSPSGRHLLVAEVSGEIHLWSSVAQSMVPFRLHHAQLSTMAFSRDEETLATAGLDGTITLWDLTSGRATTRLRSSVGNTAVLEWSRDQNRLFSGSLNGILTVWDPVTSRETFVHQAHRQPITGLRELAQGDLVTFAPDGICRWPAPN